MNLLKIKKKDRQVNIVNYLPKYKKAFKQLNEEWIKLYFKIEEEDKKSLNYPEEYIINKGGKILFAINNNDDVLGVCALIKLNNKYDFELAKMAVSSKAQGKGIGYLLGKSIVETAKSLRASNIYLESNTILQPAISLYKKLGFKKIENIETPYERCNIQMELKLK